MLSQEEGCSVSLRATVTQQQGSPFNTTTDPVPKGVSGADLLMDVALFLPECLYLHEYLTFIKVNLAFCDLTSISAQEKRLPISLL
jgi:hypothetical protein